MNLLNIGLIALQAVNVGKDVSLPLPIPEWLLVVVLILMFLVHLAFVNLMFGGTALSLYFEIKGKKQSEYRTLAEEISQTITVNKSMAVVMGVAPLLAINTLYTKFFYAANALTGLVWIMVVPLLIVAFLLLYLHKYSYNSLKEKPNLHIAILSVPMAIFLFIPLIFLTNINLMLFPDKWSVVTGFWDALLLPSVFSRYFHFINASFALTGIFLFWHFGRAKYAFKEKFGVLNRKLVQRQFYRVAFWASMLQFLVGPIILLVLPSVGLKPETWATILTGATVALIPTFYLWKEISGDINVMGRYFGRIALFFTLTVLIMGSGRHLYRANALQSHRETLKENTTAFHIKQQAAQKEALIIAEKAKNSISGKAIFESKCTMCHAMDVQTVGPSMKEVIQIYSGNKQGLIEWTKAPGKKRPNAAQMPGFKGQLSDKELDALSTYILNDMDK